MSKNKTQTFVLACGGTGGHLAPGIAVAEALQARGHNCWLVVSEKVVDTRLLQKYPHLQFVKLPGVRFSLKPFAFCRFLWHQSRGFLATLRWMRQVRPDAVVGFGGFTCVNIFLVGLLLGCRRFLHEANHVPGRVTRLFSPILHKIYLPNGVSLNGRCRLTPMGYPLRAEMRPVPKDEARRELNMPEDGKLLLVVGGSQGASKLNTWVEQFGPALLREGVSVLCIAGLKQPCVEIFMDASGAQLKKVPFMDTMATAFSAADVVVARAGAGTIAECLHFRVPTILVPYPYAADNHQLANARAAEKYGCCVISEDKLEQLHPEVQRHLRMDRPAPVGIDGLEVTVRLVEDLLKSMNGYLKR